MIYIIQLNFMYVYITQLHCSVYCIVYTIYHFTMSVQVQYLFQVDLQKSSWPYIIVPEKRLPSKLCANELLE